MLRPLHDISDQGGENPKHWAELKGGAKRTEKQNLARMARRKLFFETLRKLFLRRSAEGNSGHF